MRIQVRYGIRCVCRAQYGTFACCCCWCGCCCGFEFADILNSLTSPVVVAPTTTATEDSYSLLLGNSYSLLNTAGYGDLVRRVRLLLRLLLQTCYTTSAKQWGWLDSNSCWYTISNLYCYTTIRCGRSNWLYNQYCCGIRRPNRYYFSFRLYTGIWN